MTRPKAHLTITRGDEVGRRYVIRAGQRFIIGRAADCSISLNDQLISRHHTALELSHKGLLITDLSSRNGTKLDEKKLKVNSPELAYPSDILEIGKHSIKIELFGIDETAPARASRTHRDLRRAFLPANEFEILGEIGQGATGIVYGAKQIMLQRNVAIKIPRVDVDDYEDCRQRFIREGRLCSKIKSPFVVTIYDLRLQGDKIFIVMELINGGSAFDRISVDHKMPIAEVAQLGSDIAQALHAMHRLEIIHRDIKPSNILLTPKGAAKLADFGIAKQLGEKADEIRRLTGTDEGIGTLGYIPPEVACFSELGTYSDVYSLGATLYHLVTGMMPFVATGTSVADVLNQIAYEDALPISSLRPDCPPQFIRLIESMMAKEPKDRPNAIAASVFLDKIVRKTTLDEPKHQEGTDAFDSSEDSLIPIIDGPLTDF